MVAWWKKEVAKMAVYMYTPVFLWFMLNTKTFQKHVLVPHLQANGQDASKLPNLLIDVEEDDEPWIEKLRKGKT